MPAESRHGEAYRAIRLCIDTYERGNPAGRFYHPGAGAEGDGFESLIQLLVKIDGLLDETNFPQSFTAKRSFAPLQELPKPDKAHGPASRDGAMATFLLRIMFRQHASWQGSVTWLEGKGEQTFRSVLELILLLDSALGGCVEK